ncbi:MAG TPA: hypothetical protein VLK30_05520 [Candidatus Limnocylindrales bacterium]|nr:hypothetical protein [Candidatus Limnocylindrales bacterium]
MLRLFAALSLALALLPAAASAGSADPPPPPTYAEAVQRAYDLIQGASPRDLAPAKAALEVLVLGTGSTQPEIIADLLSRPPLYEDASKRLAALMSALGQPATTSDPELAQQRLHDVMSMSRYDALHRPPSVWDRIQQWIQDRISDLLRLLFGGGRGAQAPAIWFYATGIAVLLAIVFLFARGARGRFSQPAGAAGGGPRAPADYFAEADRLAANGDRVGAIRALCAAVAATLAGERSWEGSPLTVREIFQRAPDYPSLRPLLLPFEAAVYGGRDVDQPTYDRAALVAAAFRVQAEIAA